MRQNLSKEMGYIMKHKRCAECNLNGKSKRSTYIGKCVIQEYKDIIDKDYIDDCPCVSCLLKSTCSRDCEKRIYYVDSIVTDENMEALYKIYGDDNIEQLNKTFLN